MRYVNFRALVACTGILLCGLTFANTGDEANLQANEYFDPAPIVQGTGSLSGLLFMGTAQNSTDPAGTLNDVFTVDPSTDASNSILSGVGVWGATADLANNRILFTRSSGTGFGDEVFEVPFGGGTPTSLGLLTDAAGATVRIDGLAISGGQLYGSNAGGGAANGLYEINLGTLTATQIAAYTDSISGIDSDAGTIYGVNDTAGQVVTLATDGTITNVVAYPGGLADIDGIACGNGKCYLVTDESGEIPVLDLGSNTYDPSLTSPFGSADVFSGAALAGGDPGGGDGGPATPATSTWGVIALIAALMLISTFYLRRRVKA